MHHRRVLHAGNRPLVEVHRGIDRGEACGGTPAGGEGGAGGHYRGAGNGSAQGGQDNEVKDVVFEEVEIAPITNYKKAANRKFAAFFVDEYFLIYMPFSHWLTKKRCTFVEKCQGIKLRKYDK